MKFFRFLKILLNLQMIECEILFIKIISFKLTMKKGEVSVNTSISKCKNNSRDFEMKEKKKNNFSF